MRILLDFSTLGTGVNNMHFFMARISFKIFTNENTKRFIILVSFQVITYCTEWLGGEVIRIVRHVGQSPCSTYTSELLRNLCLHISLAFDFQPKHHSYELGELSIWFQVRNKFIYFSFYYHSYINK